MTAFVFAMFSVVAFAADGSSLATLYEKDFAKEAAEGEFIFDIDSGGWTTASSAWNFYTSGSMPDNSPMVIHKTNQTAFAGLAGSSPVAVYDGDVGSVFKVSGGFSSFDARSISLWFNSICENGTQIKSGFRFEYAYSDSGTLSLKYTDGAQEYTLCSVSGSVNYKWIPTSFELSCGEGKANIKIYNAYSRVETPELDIAALCLQNGIAEYNTSGKFAFAADDKKSEITVLRSVKIESEKAFVAVSGASVGSSSVSVSAKYGFSGNEVLNAVCAVYDGTGVLVGAKTKSVLPGSGEIAFDVETEGMGAPLCVKVFLNGSDGFVPLCGAAEYLIDGGVCT